MQVISSIVVIYYSNYDIKSSDWTLIEDSLQADQGFQVDRVRDCWFAIPDLVEEDFHCVLSGVKSVPKQILGWFWANRSVNLGQARRHRLSTLKLRV